MQQAHLSRGYSRAGLNLKKSGPIESACHGAEEREDGATSAAHPARDGCHLRLKLVEL
jgi:hypothetical protein